MPNRIQSFLQGLIGIKPEKVVEDKRKAIKAPSGDLVPFSPITGLEEWVSNLDLEAQLQEYRGWVYTAASKIAQEVANIRLTLNKLDEKGNAEEVLKHPALDLLDRVNPFLTFYDLVENTMLYLELTGNCYWWLVKPGSEITEIYPWLRPDRMVIVPSADKFIDGYKYRVPGTSEFQRFEVDEIIHFKYPNPIDPYYGVSAVKAAAMSIATDNKSKNWNYRFFGNNAEPGIIISTEDSMGEEDFKRFITQWENRHKEGHEHRPAVISGSTKVEKLNNSQRDMEFLKQQQFSRDEILAIFKVPKAIVDPQEVNYASAKAAKEIFLEEVIVPKMQKFVNALNEFLLPHFNDDRLFFDFENPTSITQEEKDKHLESLAKVGAISPNEIRQEDNRPPFEGGDSIYLPGTMVPIGEENEATKGFKLGEVVDSKKIRKYNVRVKKRSTVAEMVAKIKHELKDSKVLEKKKKVLPKEKNLKSEKELFGERLWRAKIQRTDEDERAMIKLLRKEFIRQEKQVLSSLHEKSIGFTFNVQDEAKIFLELFVPFITALVKDWGEQALVMLGLSGFDITQGVSDYLKNDGVEFVKGINEVTKDKLKKHIADGVANGEGIRDIRKRVEKVFLEANTSRAEAIARTEVAKSSNFATKEAWKQSNVVKGKEWFTALDERVCDVCSPRHGDTVMDLDGDFQTTDETFGKVEEPPAHVRCRCVMLPIMKTKEDHNREMKKESDELKKTVDEAGSSLKEINKIKDKLSQIVNEGQEKDSKGA